MGQSFFADCRRPGRSADDGASRRKRPVAGDGQPGHGDVREAGRRAGHRLDDVEALDHVVGRQWRCADGPGDRVERLGRSVAAIGAVVGPQVSGARRGVEAGQQIVGFGCRAGAAGRDEAQGLQYWCCLRWPVGCPSLYARSARARSPTELADQWWPGNRAPPGTRDDSWGMRTPGE
jgi:hypothetical protein